MEKEIIFNEKKIEEIENNNEIKSLDDLYMIEGVALKIKNLIEKVNFYKDYKKKKTAEIDEEIEKIDNRITFLKKIILKTLQDNNEKSLNFPGSCNVITRKPPSTWLIKNEDAFFKKLKEEKEFDRIVETAVFKNIVKKEANKLLNAWEQSGKIEELPKDSVEKKQNEINISLTFGKKNKKKKKNKKETIFVNKEEDYDKLDFS